MGGIHHLGLAVSNLSASSRFFCELLGFAEVNRIAQYPAIFISNGKVTLTLWQTQQDALPFNRHQQVGLHHLAIQVDAINELLALYEKCQCYQGVEIEFGPEPVRSGQAQHLMLMEPSGIRVELIWVPE